MDGGGGGTDGNREYSGIEHGGDGGGLIASKYDECGNGGTQNTGFALGKGQGSDDAGVDSRYGAPGAGGGWYGGFHSSGNGWEGAGGGSGYVLNESSKLNAPTRIQGWK